MGQGERTTRKSIVQYARDAIAAAQEARERVTECVSATNKQAMQVTRLAERTLALEQARTDIDKRFNAQGLMITGFSEQIKAVRDHADLECAKETEARNRLAGDQRTYVDRGDRNLGECLDTHGAAIGSLHDRLHIFETLTFFGRLRYLFTGRLPLPGAAMVSAESAERVAHLPCVPSETPHPDSSR